ncbi:MAG: DUF6686 family protein [Bacteroidota bacterium]
MCKSKILVKSKIGHVHWCQKCKNFTVVFNNNMVGFKHKGLLHFKENLMACYDYHLSKDHNHTKRSITFDTNFKGIRFLFSLEEVAELLAMIQSAELSHYLAGSDDTEELT